MEDYYQILNVGREAARAEIQAAYRRLVRRCHPDLHPDDPGARDKFLKIQRAFEVLDNPEKRASYDPDKPPADPTPPPNSRRRRARRLDLPPLQSLIFYRSAWHAYCRRACQAADDDEEAALRKLKAWTLASLLAGYLLVLVPSICWLVFFTLQ